MANRKFTQEIDFKTNINNVIADLSNLQKSFKVLDDIKKFKESEIKTIGNKLKAYQKELVQLNNLKNQYYEINGIINALVSSGETETKIGQKRITILAAQSKELLRQIRLKDSLFGKEKDYSKYVERARTVLNRKGFDKITGIFEDRLKAKASSSTISAEDKAAANKSLAIFSIVKMIAKEVDDGIKKIVGSANKILTDTIGTNLSLKAIFNDIKTQIGNYLSREGIASYDTTTSLFTNRSAREQQIRYGIRAGQSFALTKTMSALGIANEEDMMYMNTQQKAMFDQLMNRYQSWYDELNRNGTLREVQQFQLEFQIFKEEIAMEFLQWFAKNKDLIFSAIKNIANFVMQIAKGITTITTLFGRNKSANSVNNVGVGVMSDRLTYESTGKNVNIIINQSNNPTGVINDTSEWQEMIDSNNEKLIKELTIALGG